MSGWIKLHRQIREHWIWDDPDYLKAWICILLMANHEDKKVLINCELIECKRGQSVMSVSSWAKIFGKGWTRQRVRTFFELLKNDSMINQEGLNKTTRLTICKYEDYQEQQPTENQQTTNRKPTDNQQITTNKNVKNEKKEEYPVGFEKIIEKWIQYKTERKEAYKKTGLEAFIKQLLKFSENNPAKASKIIEQSMANNWAGIFELKINGTKQQTYNEAPIYKELMPR